MPSPREPEIVEHTQLYTEISKSKLVVLIKQAEVSNNIICKLNNKNFTCTPIYRRLYGSAMMHSPKFGLETMEISFPW